jgi:Ni/Co efflux regulator RcnB
MSLISFKNVARSTAIFAAAGLLASAAFAQQGRGDDRHDQQDSYGHNQSRDYSRMDHRDSYRQEQSNDRARMDRRDSMPDRNQPGWDRHDHDHGYPGYGRPAHFERGGHLPPAYRNRQYVVNDWRGNHLRQPPRGYQWVQVGADYALVAVVSGLIAQVLLNGN